MVSGRSPGSRTSVADISISPVTRSIGSPPLHLPAMVGLLQGVVDAAAQAFEPVQPPFAQTARAPSAVPRTRRPRSHRACGPVPSLRTGPRAPDRGPGPAHANPSDDSPPSNPHLRTASVGLFHRRPKRGVEPIRLPGRDVGSGDPGPVEPPDEGGSNRFASAPATHHDRAHVRQQGRPHERPSPEGRPPPVPMSAAARPREAAGPRALSRHAPFPAVRQHPGGSRKLADHSGGER